jgi:hypothetical protein
MSIPVEKEKKTKNPRKQGLKTRGRGTWKTDRPPVLTMVKRGQTQR